MKVILLKDVRGCGQANTVVSVADGYAHNFLLPHKYAVAATDEKIKELEIKKAQSEAAKQQAEADLAKKVQSLEGKTIKIAVRSTEKGGLFKAVTPADVSKQIRLEYALEIPESAIEMDHIKTTGEHKVVLQGKAAKATLGIIVTPQ